MPEAFTFSTPTMDAQPQYFFTIGDERYTRPQPTSFASLCQRKYVDFAQKVIQLNIHKIFARATIDELWQLALDEAFAQRTTSRHQSHALRARLGWAKENVRLHLLHRRHEFT